MMKALSGAFKGIGGEFEIQRILGGFGTVMYIVMVPAFVWAGKVSATLDTFCLVYPTGLGVCIGATAGAIALKDRQTATSRVIEQTGAQPGMAAAAPPADPDTEIKP